MRKKNLVTGTEGQANYFSIATPKKVYSYPFPFLSMLPIPRRLMYPRVYSCPTTFFLRLLQPLPASPLPHLSYSGELASWRSIQQCQQPGEGWLSGDILRQGLLGLLLMRLGKGIGNGLINRAGGLLGTRKRGSGWRVLLSQSWGWGRYSGQGESSYTAGRPALDEAEGVHILSRQTRSSSQSGVV